MRKLYRLFAVLGILATALLPFSKAWAIAIPDTVPQVSAVYAYTLPDGGLGVLIDYYLDYAVLPTETATESFLGVFVDTDQVTQLKAVAPYTFVNSGYHRGLIWIQFTAAEVTTYGLTSTNQAFYRIWLIGNPTLTWVPAVTPLTVSTISQWSATSALLAARVLNYADILELAWSLDMIEATSLGNRLTTTGASYFINVIPDLRTLAPAVFSNSTTNPAPEPIDYTTLFGATLTSTVVAGSPLILVTGANALNTTGAGTLTLTLEQGTEGTVAGAVIAGTPAEIVQGTNTITATGAGAFTVTVALVNTQTQIDSTVVGTGLDATSTATAFGLSREMFSTAIWFVLGIVVCAGLYAKTKDTPYGNNMGKGVFVLLGIWMLIGWVVGQVSVIVMAVIVIGCAALVIVQLVHRQANY